MARANLMLTELLEGGMPPYMPFAFVAFLSATMRS